MYKLDIPKNIFDIFHGTVLTILRTQKNFKKQRVNSKKPTFPEEHISKDVKDKDSMS